MIIYTFQTKTKYKKLLKEGVVYGSEERTVERYWGQQFLYAYRYLSDLMGIGTLPIFGWTEKPDMRKSEFRSDKDKNVLLTLEIPDELITFTDFESWHYVLNKWYLAENTKDWKKNKNLSWYVWYEKKAVEDSWSRILNIRGKKATVQATFEKISKDQIIGVRDFTCPNESQ